MVFQFWQGSMLNFITSASRHHFTSALNVFQCDQSIIQWFIGWILCVLLNSKIFLFLAICCFFMWNTFKIFFSVILYTFWTMSNPRAIVTSDTSQQVTPTCTHHSAVKKSTFKRLLMPALNSCHFLTVFYGGP